MSDPAQTTRELILRAAARQFARRPYHDVGLDDILADAALTKGAMYFHFRSKWALALAVIEDHIAKDSATVEDLIDRNLSGLEAIVDICYLIAGQDIGRHTTRAVLDLASSVGRATETWTSLLEGWLQTLTPVVERAIAEGDIIEQCQPHHLIRALISVYLGLRQTSDLDEPQQFLSHIENGWDILLPGIVPPERLDYLRQFIRRRTALAIRATSTGAAPDVRHPPDDGSSADGYQR